MKIDRNTEEERQFTAADRRAISDVIATHDVRLAILFGSVVDDPEPADLGIAVKFVWSSHGTD